MRKISINLPDVQYLAMQKKKERDEISMTEIIKRAISFYFSIPENRTFMEKTE